MMWIVIAVLLAVVVVQFGLLLVFLANRVIPFMESVKTALKLVTGDQETGGAGAVKRVKAELSEISGQLRLLGDSKVLFALQRIEDHLFIDVCRAIQDSTSTAALNDLAIALNGLAREISLAQGSLDGHLKEIAKYTCDMSIRTSL